jgi:hypothetical protein
MTSKHQAFLVRLMRMLVEEWGYDEARKALAQLSDMGNGAHIAASRERGPQKPSTNRKGNRSKKPTAVEQVTRLSLLDGERDTLLAIAAKFDRKEFLPSVGDIREFLAMMGADSGGMKDRLDGFRRLLPPLSQLPPDKLKHLASSTTYSGPAQLGPLSDAIRSTGEAIRRSEKAPEPEQKS